MILFSFRCKGLHGLDAQLLLKLGKTYECHALEASATADADEHAHKMVAVLEARAALYFKVILHYWLHGFMEDYVSKYSVNEKQSSISTIDLRRGLS